MGSNSRQTEYGFEANQEEKDILMELADELLRDNYGSIRFRELINRTDIVDTGIRWQVSNEITRRLLQHVLDRNETWTRF